jgi:hypothetical protein
VKLGSDGIYMYGCVREINNVGSGSAHCPGPVRLNIEIMHCAHCQLERTAAKFESLLCALSHYYFNCKKNITCVTKGELRFSMNLSLSIAMY